MTLTQHRLTPAGSAQPNLTLLSSAWPGTTQPSGSYWVKESWRWTLGPADIRALTAFSLSWLSVWRSPFFYLVFLLSLLLLLLRLVCLPNTFTFKDGAVVWCFTVERSGAEMTVCSTLCVRVFRARKRISSGVSRRARGDRWRGRDGRCEVMTSVVLRFSEVCKGIAFFWQMKRCVFQVLRQHPFHHYRGKQSAYCVERRVLGSCSPLIQECTSSLTRVSVTSSSPVKLSMTFSWNIWFRVTRMCRPRLIYSTI